MEECQRGEGIMMNFNNKRTRQIVSSVIIILLVLAMVAPMVLGALSM